MSNDIQLRDYIGDGVYVGFDGYSIVMTTEDGISVQNRIVLEPALLRAFDRYRERLKAHVAARDKSGE